MIAENAIFIPTLYAPFKTRWMDGWKEQFGTATELRITQVGPPQRSFCVRALEREVSKYPNGSVWVVAHDLGCHILAQWALTSKQQLAGAFLVAPPDIRSYETGKRSLGFWPPPTRPFRFPSMVVVSNNDSLCPLQVSHLYATVWQSELVNIGPQSHLLRGDLSDDWEEGLTLLTQFCDDQDGIAAAAHGASWIHGGLSLSSSNRPLYR